MGIDEDAADFSIGLLARIAWVEGVCQLSVMS